MTTKWEYQGAIQESDLPGPARWIATLISSRADKDTCVVPDRFAWSLEELARASGFSEATVKRQLNLLEDQGWLKRSRAGVGRNSYSGFIPRGGSAERAISDSGIAHSAPAHSELSAQSDLINESERSVDEVTASHPYKEVHQVHQSIEEPSSSAEPPRPDVERICRHLAERMIANGCKPPTITHRWRDAARLLLDRDGRTEDQVIRAIDWATADEFWKANILSVPTLRAKYEQLRLAAERKRQANSRASPSAPPSNAPVVIPAAEQCPDHRGQRRDSCRICASNRKAAPR